MIREIVTDPIFLSQKSEQATKSDQQTICDLLDMIQANSDRCVGMAANMIGVLNIWIGSSKRKKQHSRALKYRSFSMRWIILMA